MKAHIKFDGCVDLNKSDNISTSDEHSDYIHFCELKDDNLIYRKDLPRVSESGTMHAQKIKLGRKSLKCLK